MTTEELAGQLAQVVTLLESIRDLHLEQTKLIVGSPEACRRLGIGWEQLNALVAAGDIKRVPNLRGRGNAHCYAVAELERFAATGLRTGLVPTMDDRPAS